MPRAANKTTSSPRTVGSATPFNPSAFLNTWDPITNLPRGTDGDSQNGQPSSSSKNRLDLSIAKAFGIKVDDGYVYHAMASVTLPQVQKAVDAGGRFGLHAWYHGGDGEQLEPPLRTDIEAYTSIFSDKTSTTAALNTMLSAGKKDSIRRAVATHLLSNYIPPHSLPSSTSTSSQTTTAADIQNHNADESPIPPFQPSQTKTQHLTLPTKKQHCPIKNPYLDFWTWSCHALEWTGPTAETVNVKISHHILPIFYHHFGCVCPSWDALSLIQQICKTPKDPELATTGTKKKKKKGGGKPGDSSVSNPPNRTIVEIGSGNGYWAFLLRQLDLRVVAVDNALSDWRTTWLEDSIITDGIGFLASPAPAETAAALGGAGCPEAVLLLVYPQVSNDFTSQVIKAYKGRTVVVAGTQNGNGFTGFKDETIATWMARERPEFEKIVQIPLPSFAGKDEALFMFERRDNKGVEGSEVCRV